MPYDQADALDYVSEASQAYADALARGDKQRQLRTRQRTLTEAWMFAMQAGVPDLKG